MSVYERFVLPHLINWTCGQRPNQKQRQKIVPRAMGHVLDVGCGSGLNIPFYDSLGVASLVGLDPSQEMLSLARRKMRQAAFPVSLVAAPAEEIPLDDRSIDTVVLTYTLCTVSDVPRAMKEIGRVLKEDGQLLFCEHGVAPDERVAGWQRRLNPLWRRVSGGCNLNRAVPSLIESNGFRIRDLSTMYIPGWRPASFNYWGSATIGSLP